MIVGMVRQRMLAPALCHCPSPLGIGEQRADLLDAFVDGMEPVTVLTIVGELLDSLHVRPDEGAAKKSMSACGPRSPYPAAPRHGNGTCMKGA